MHRSLRFLFLCGAAFALLAPSAGATVVETSPGSLDFGAQQVGTTSRPQMMTLEVGCTSYVPLAGYCGSSTTDVFFVSAETTGDFSAMPGGADPCQSVEVPTGTPEQTCQIVVTFTPTAAGPRTGNLSTGAGAFPAEVVDGPGPGPTVPLSGRGTVGPVDASAAPGGRSEGKAGPGGNTKRCKKAGRKHRRCKRR